VKRRPSTAREAEVHGSVDNTEERLMPRRTGSPSMRRTGAPVQSIESRHLPKSASTSLNYYFSITWGTRVCLH